MEGLSYFKRINADRRIINADRSDDAVRFTGKVNPSGYEAPDGVNGIPNKKRTGS